MATETESSMTEIDFSTLGRVRALQAHGQPDRAAAIALVTTLAADGTVNAAPFGVFNMVGEDPPVVMLSVNKLQDGQLEDTAAHILRTQRVRGAPGR